MVKQATAQDRGPLATANDVYRILGTLDETKLLDIMALRPTILDIERQPFVSPAILTSLTLASHLSL